MECAPKGQGGKGQRGEGEQCLVPQKAQLRASEMEPTSGNGGHPRHREETFLQKFMMCLGIGNGAWNCDWD